MHRINSFNNIHKALRAFLYDTALTLQQTCFDDAEEAAPALEKVASVLDAFDSHAHHEDHFVLPAIEKYDKQLVDEFEKEHVTDLMLSNRLRNMLNIYNHAVSGEEKLYAGSAICKSFGEFMIFNLQHMAKEELLLVPVLWKYYSDKELIELNQRLVASIPPNELAKMSRWMILAINHTEAVNWIKGVRQSAPEMVFRALIDIAAAELPAERWNRLRESINEGVLLAS